MNPVRRSIRRRGGRGDGGATLIIMTLLLFTIFVVVAIVIDLSAVRQNRQADKSATDLASTAGIRLLDTTGSGSTPWPAICEAFHYLDANNEEIDASAMTVTYLTGEEDLQPHTCSSPPSTTCADSNPATWGILRAVTADARVTVEVRSGYDLDPLLSGFPEDGARYSGDDGGDPCEHVAVVVYEGEGTYFGGVAGATGYDTVIRSVARLSRGTGGEVAPALLLLEREKCEVLLIGGDSGAIVRVEGFGTSPGVVHADTDATDEATCDPDDAENGNIFQVNSNPGAPRIISAASSDDSGKGEMTTVAMGGDADSQAAVSSPRPTEVCIEAATGDCAPPDLASEGIGFRELVSRSVVDTRYLSRASHYAALSPWDLTDAERADQEYTTIGCNDAIPATGAKLFVQCNGNAFSGAGKTFGPNFGTVVINGYVEVGGNNNTLRFDAVDELFIRGRSDGAGVQLAGGEGNVLAVNAGSDPTSACATSAVSYADSAKIVIGHGYLESAGGTDADDPKVLRLCQSVLIMADNHDSSCPIPGTVGTEPDDNTCRGRIRIAGQATVDWTAPNVVDGAPATDFSNFEDLAFWTETQGAGIEWGIVGNGNVRLGGIFFSPNADPIRVGGNGTYDIEDAQFVTRRLQVTGNAGLTMQPNPADSVTIPAIEGYRLVR